MHLSQLEKVDGIDSRSLAVSRAHSFMFAGLMVMRSIGRKESSEYYSDKKAVCGSMLNEVAGTTAQRCKCGVLRRSCDGGSGIVVGRSVS